MHDLIARLAHESDPIKAVIELIWNAIDAEAWGVTVEVEREPELGGIIALHVEDDGHGISVDEVATAFGRIGDSWKRHSERSKNDVRAMNGTMGEGRLRAFALGSRVRWQSRAAITGLMHELTITGQRANRTVFNWESVAISDQRSGTIFSAYNDEQRSLGALQNDATLAALRSPFAPLLLNEPRLQITFDGVTLDPAEEIVADTQITVPIDENGDEVGQLDLRIIEWQKGKHRMIYYGPDVQHFTFEESGTDVESQFTYSAYVTWSGLRDQADQLALGELAPDPINEVWRTARRAIREHFIAQRRLRRREQVKIWKDTGVYPYQGEAVSEPEIAERTVFDVISGTLSPQIARNRSSARLTLALLKDAITHDPEKLTTILHEVVALKAEDRDTLTSLLGETTLPAIIKSANIVATRNRFLLALEHLLFDPIDARTVGERDHLHHLLEGELWIFGEGYHMMNSEKGLTQLLRTHLKLSGLPDKKIAPVKRWDGKTGRVDLHLAAKFQEHDRIRHLIVELKAPDVEINRVELDQVEDYGNAILSNSQFASESSQWDIILVGTAYIA